ncbi:hypothetical protein VCHA49P379_210058 [Vibrio chagasii]|nr:hypothetical protein VCHA49P379_210058 [Vibrio chagasii]
MKIEKHLINILSVIDVFLSANTTPIRKTGKYSNLKSKK